MGLGVEPRSPGTALNAPPPWTALCSALGGGQVGEGQMGTGGKPLEFITLEGKECDGL